MLFNSYVFVLFFLPLTLMVYFAINQFGYHRVALVVLFLFSLLFYTYNNVELTLVLVISIAGNYLLAYGINHCERAQIGKVLLLIGISLNIGSIFYFKYLNFCITNLNTFFQKDIQLRNIVLPLGISFYTFQQISYLIDTYRGETYDYSFMEYAAFVSFFPQLIAGPIVLHSEVIPQFRDKKRWRFDHDNFASGIYLFAIGMTKKVIIADTLGRAVAWGWSGIDTLTSMEIVMVMLSFTFQLYFDFSGYCDMAVGIGKMFNIELPVNFLSPYKSYSILEFWKRWHITLTRFLRNYVYIPLGGSKKGRVRTYINIMLVFLLSGIWHGANWTFILWGVLHGLAQVLNRIFKRTWDRCNQVFQWLCTFAFVNVMWLLFRADNVLQAFDLIKRMLRMDDLTIRVELYNCYALPEIDWMIHGIKLLLQLKEQIPGIYMWGFLGAALFICLNCDNLYEKLFKPTLGRALLTSLLMIWTIVSLGDITTFLYFNF